MESGVMFSFGVFFKPIIADFGWSRGVTSGVNSTRMVIHGLFAMPMGWLADKFGPAKVMVFCGLMIGFGLVLSSRIDMLWQFYLAYGLIVGIGLSGVFSIAVGTTARWFRKYRGLALGMVVSGAGLGTLIIVPIIERFIAGYGWPTTYLYFGIIASSVMVISALVLRHSPEKIGYSHNREKEEIFEPDTDHEKRDTNIVKEADFSLKSAFRTRPIWLIFFIYSFVQFSIQMVMVHLVNHATDVGISSLAAATLVSAVGTGSIIGRLTMGTVSDRIGSIKSMTICCTILTSSLILLIFAENIWMFYLFAIGFGFSWGGVVPQQTLLINRYYGLQSVSALVGVIVIGVMTGGALSSWLGGQIFDMTSSYRAAFTLAAVVSSISFVALHMLRKVK
jgi:MFS family permease